MIRLRSDVLAIRRYPFVDFGGLRIHYGDIASSALSGQGKDSKLGQLIIEHVGGGRTILVMPLADAVSLHGQLEEIVTPSELRVREPLLSGAAQQICDGMVERVGPNIRNMMRFICNQAIAYEASDMHWETSENGMAVSLRRDGILFDFLRFPSDIGNRLVSALKVAAGLHHYYQDAIQEGRIRHATAQGMQDLRVSVIPAPPFEKIAIRLFDKLKGSSTFEELGYSEPVAGELKKAASATGGLYIICGPSSSGKTTTLYALMRYISETRRGYAKILSIEDPIEYRLRGITQVQVNEQAGLTYAKILMSSLRQDLSVFMVGEIRDSVTADAAVQAALTGHLVITTLHCGSATEAVARLLDLGAKPVMLKSTLKAVHCQRLIRELCPRCGRATADGDANALTEHREYPVRSDYGGPMDGVCPECKGFGYRGRRPIGEVLVIHDDIARLILREADTATIDQAAEQQGMCRLREAGMALVARTITDINEVVRVLG